MNTTRRNDPCPCGSGKKYKKCCLARESAGHGLEEDRGTELALDWIRTRQRRGQTAALEEFLSVLVDPDGFVPDEVKRFGEMLDINIGEWLLTEAVYPAQGSPRHAVDLLLGEGGPGLLPHQREWLRTLADAPLALYEVVEMEREKGLLLLDTLEPAAEPIFVNERAGTRNARPGLFLGVRIVEYRGRVELSGAMYPFMEASGLELAYRIEGALGEMDHRTPPGRHIAARTIRDAWLEEISGLRPMPTVVDAGTGQPLILTTEHYEILDLETLIERLGREPDVDGDEEHGWVRLEKKRGGDGPIRILWAMSLARDRTRLEVVSHAVERADEAREWLEGIATDAVRHLTRIVQDPTSAVGPAAQARQGAEEDRPATGSHHEDLGLTSEEMTAIAQRMVEHVYRDWAEQPIPALDNLSPREAVKTPRGKTRVSRLLRTYERDEARKAEESGHAPAHLAFLYEQVGLTPSR